PDPPRALRHRRGGRRHGPLPLHRGRLVHRRAAQPQRRPVHVTALARSALRRAAPPGGLRASAFPGARAAMLPSMHDLRDAPPAAAARTARWDRQRLLVVAGTFILEVFFYDDGWLSN